MVVMKVNLALCLIQITIHAIAWPGSATVETLLKSVPNTLSSEAHATLDLKVVNAIKKQPPEEAFLLWMIVSHSDGLLDPKYIDMSNAIALLEEEQQLTEMLNTAWGKRQFRDIRNLGVVIVQLRRSLINVSYSCRNSASRP